MELESNAGNAANNRRPYGYELFHKSQGLFDVFSVTEYDEGEEHWPDNDSSVATCEATSC